MQMHIFMHIHIHGHKCIPTCRPAYLPAYLRTCTLEGVSRQTERPTDRPTGQIHIHIYILRAYALAYLLTYLLTLHRCTGTSRHLTSLRFTLSMLLGLTVRFFAYLYTEGPVPADLFRRDHGSSITPHPSLTHEQTHTHTQPHTHTHNKQKIKQQHGPEAAHPMLQILRLKLGNHEAATLNSLGHLMLSDVSVRLREIYVIVLSPVYALRV